MLGRVATMLSHFYVSEADEAQMRAMMADWRDALEGFPRWAIAEACSEYLRTQERKPTIAAIVKLCDHHFAVVEYTRQKAMRGPVVSDVPRSDNGQAQSNRDRVAKIGEDALRAMRARVEARK